MRERKKERESEKERERERGGEGKRREGEAWQGGEKKKCVSYIERRKEKNREELTKEKWESIFGMEDFLRFIDFLYIYFSLLCGKFDKSNLEFIVLFVLSKSDGASFFKTYTHANIFSLYLSVHYLHALSLSYFLSLSIYLSIKLYIHLSISNTQALAITSIFECLRSAFGFRWG